MPVLGSLSPSDFHFVNGRKIIRINQFYVFDSHEARIRADVVIISEKFIGRVGAE